MLGRDQVGDRDRLILVPDQNEGPEPLQAVASQSATAQPAELILQRRDHPVDQPLLPGDQDAGARRMLGLADQVGGEVIAGTAEPSAITTTSLGPAMLSMSTVP